MQVERTLSCVVVSSYVPAVRPFLASHHECGDCMQWERGVHDNDLSMRKYGFPNTNGEKAGLAWLQAGWA
jgi:hypothetical protein